MKLRNHKCPACPKKYTMSSSLSRHKASMLKKGDKAHLDHYGVKPKAEPLPLHPDEERSPPSFASPPSVKRKDEPEKQGLSDDLDQLALPGPETEPDYVPPVEGMPQVSPFAEVPFENTQKVMEYAGNLVKAFGEGKVDSLTKMDKVDYELMAKHITSSRGQDVSPAMAASVVYLKFIVFLVSNLLKGTQRVMAKRKEKMVKKAVDEKEAQEAVKEDEPSGM